MTWAPANVSTARGERSPRFPIGVATRTMLPLPSLASLPSPASVPLASVPMLTTSPSRVSRSVTLESPARSPHESPSRSPHLQRVAHGQAPPLERSRFPFDHQPGPQARHPHPPGSHPAHTDHDEILIAVGDVDRKPHAEGVHGPCPLEHQGAAVAVSALQTLAHGEAGPDDFGRGQHIAPSEQPGHRPRRSTEGNLVE